MAMMRHPLNHIVYRRLDDGTVRVGDESSGEGVFDRHGQWLSGERRLADPYMCLWVSDGYDVVASMEMQAAAFIPQEEHV